jgi:type I restriction enzyme S subunit
VSFPIYPEYRQSGVDWLGDIPADWEVKPLKSVAWVINGYPFSSDRFGPDGEWPLIRIRDLNKKVPATFYNGEAVEQASIDNNDVLIGMDGDFNVGRWLGPVPAMLNQRMCAVRSHNPIICRLLFYSLPEPLGMINATTYSTTVKHLSSSQVEGCRLAIPSDIKEKVAIVAFLDHETGKIDGLIAEQERLIAVLDEKRLAVVSHAVTKGLNPNVEMKDSGLEWLGDIPAYWGRVPIRNVARLESGHTPSRTKPEYWVDNECTIPWFTLADVHQLRDGWRVTVTHTNSKISPMGLAHSSARILPAGTVFLSRTASVGFSGIMGCPMAVSQDFAAWVCGPDLLPEYLLLCLRAMKPELTRIMMGSTHKTIYMPDIEAFKIPMPPIHEQQVIVDKVFAANERSKNLIDDARVGITLLKERRSALISAAVTGKIDVRNHPAAVAALNENKD